MLTKNEIKINLASDKVLPFSKKDMMISMSTFLYCFLSSESVQSLDTPSMS